MSILQGFRNFFSGAKRKVAVTTAVALISLSSLVGCVQKKPELLKNKDIAGVMANAGDMETLIKSTETLLSTGSRDKATLRTLGDNGNKLGTHLDSLQLIAGNKELTFTEREHAEVVAEYIKSLLVQIGERQEGVQTVPQLAP